MIDIIPVDLIVHKNQAVPDILRVIFLGSVSQDSTVPASKLDQDRRSVLGKRHLLYRLAIAGVPLILKEVHKSHTTFSRCTLLVHVVTWNQRCGALSCSSG